MALNDDKMRSGTDAQKSLAAFRTPAALQRILECNPPWPFRDARGTGFRIFVTRDPAARANARAQRLVKRMYRKRGYVTTRSPLNEQSRGTVADTLTLLIEDDAGRASGTVSLVFDGVSGLPSDEIYPIELDTLRVQDRRLAEVTRLAIHERHATSKGLLIHLFDFISIYARWLKQCTDFVVAINPRHAAFYRRQLAFTVIGIERPCPRVGSAPALLLRLDMSVVEQEAARIRSRGYVSDRNLYSYSSSIKREREIAHFFERALGPTDSPQNDTAINLSGISQEHSS